MLMLNWPLVLVTTIALYGLILLSLPFNTLAATLFLFTLISFWSRLPGCGIPHPAFILYNFDVVDVFCIVISINLGGMQGAAFALFANMWSRVCGVWPDWVGVTKDSIFQAILCLIMPIVYKMTGSLMLTTWVFTIGRSFFFLTIGLLVPHRSLVNQIFTEIQFQSSLLLVNSFYVKIFGDFLDNLLDKGVSFSWPLFIFATIVVFIVYRMVFGLPSGVTAYLKKFLKKFKKDNLILKEAPSDIDEIKFIKSAVKEL